MIHVLCCIVTRHRQPLPVRAERDMLDQSIPLLAVEDHATGSHFPDDKPTHARLSVVILAKTTGQQSAIGTQIRTHILLIEREFDDLDLLLPNKIPSADIYPSFLSLAALPPRRAGKEASIGNKGDAIIRT